MHFQQFTLLLLSIYNYLSVQNLPSLSNQTVKTEPPLCNSSTSPINHKPVQKHRITNFPNKLHIFAHADDAFPLVNTRIPRVGSNIPSTSERCLLQNNENSRSLKNSSHTSFKPTPRHSLRAVRLAPSKYGSRCSAQTISSAPRKSAFGRRLFHRSP